MTIQQLLKLLILQLDFDAKWPLQNTCVIARTILNLQMSFSQVIIFLSLVLVLISIVLYTQDLQWSRVNLSHCASSRYEAITPLHMGMFRTVCLGVILTTLIHIITTPVPLEVTVLLKDGSRLLVKSLHFNRCTFFTVWSWILMVCQHKVNINHFRWIWQWSSLMLLFTGCLLPSFSLLQLYTSQPSITCILP